MINKYTLDEKIEENLKAFGKHEVFILWTNS